MTCVHYRQLNLNAINSQQFETYFLMKNKQKTKIRCAKLFIHSENISKNRNSTS